MSPAPESIRKLGPSEIEFVQLDEFSRLTTVLLIQTQIDLEKKLNIVDRAIHEWKGRDFFLQSKVFHDEANNEYFLVPALEHKRSNYNYKFLNFGAESSSSSASVYSQDQILNMLAIREAEIPFDIKSDLLWRILFLKMDGKHEQSGEFGYAIIISTHHVIMESRSVQFKLIELFEIIEAMHNDEQIKKVMFKVTPSLEQLFVEKKIDEKNLKLVSNYFYEASDLLKKMSTLKQKKMLSHSKTDQDGFLCELNGSKYVSYDDLARHYENSCTRSNYVKIPSDVFPKLVNKCKTEKTKVNACLNVVLCCAIKSLYKELGLDNSLPENLVYINSVSLRGSFLNECGSNEGEMYSPMGYLIGRYINKLSSDQVDNFDSFWSRVRDESSDMYSRIEKMEHLNKINWLLNMDSDDILIHHFFLTNIGEMSKFAKTKMFKITERYDTSYISRDYKSGLFFFSVCSMHEQLFISMNHSGRIIPDPKIAHELVDSVNKVMKKLIE